MTLHWFGKHIRHCYAPRLNFNKVDFPPPTLTVGKRVGIHQHHCHLSNHHNKQ